MINWIHYFIINVLKKFKSIIINTFYREPNSVLNYLKSIKAINSINKIYTQSKNNQNKYKSLLLDGGFYNLGYFYRLQLIRSALKSEKIKEHAFIWDSNLSKCKNLLKLIGIKNIFVLKGDFNKDIYLKAENIAKEINSCQDLLNIKLPYKLPGQFLYDTVLKRQRKDTVDLKDKNLKEYIYKFLYSIKFSEDLINNLKPDIIALSHNVSYQCTPLAWLASQKGIKTIILQGDYGIPRFWKILEPNDIYDETNRPRKKDLDKLSDKRKSRLSNVGRKYILNRISGNSSDIGSRYAFQSASKKLSELGINKKDKKIIAIYSACFFDFPHCYGMTRFIDMLDWLNLTIKKASENKEILWLLKPHPMEKWYGGIKLSQLVENKLSENIILLPYSYTGKEIINISDGLVTFHGTSGIEYAALGKPVLVADKGWYHDYGFVVFPKSREDYSNLLTKKWYENIDLDKAKYNAEIFSGMFYGIPKWQENLILPDDSDKSLLAKNLPKLVKYQNKLIYKEIKLIKKWLNSDSKVYQNFKIENNNILTNLT